MERIINLSAGAYTAQINLSRGANCIALRNTKYQASILREPNYAALDNPYLYGMPILYPNNRISGGRFLFEGREYVFPINEPSTNCHIHGFLHDTNFALLDKGEDFVVCEYVATKTAPDCDFPHEFSIKMKYQITENGLISEIEIENRFDRFFLWEHILKSIDVINRLWIRWKAHAE